MHISARIQSIASQSTPQYRKQIVNRWPQTVESFEKKRQRQKTSRAAGVLCHFWIILFSTQTCLEQVISLNKVSKLFSRSAPITRIQRKKTWNCVGQHHTEINRKSAPFLQDERLHQQLLHADHSGFCSNRNHKTCRRNKAEKVWSGIKKSHEVSVCTVCHMGLWWRYWE